MFLYASLSALLLVEPSLRAAIYPAFTASDETTGSGGTVTVAVTVQGFTSVSSAQFSLGWDSGVLQYVSATLNPSFPANTMSPTFGTTSASSGELGFAWLPASDTTVSDGTTMFTVTFNAIGANGTSSAINFTDAPTTKQITENGLADDVTANCTFTAGNVTVVPEPIEASLFIFLGILSGAQMAFASLRIHREA
jgi:Cohesin domain